MMLPFREIGEERRLIHVDGRIFHKEIRRAQEVDEHEQLAVEDQGGEDEDVLRPLAGL